MSKNTVLIKIIVLNFELYKFKHVKVFCKKWVAVKSCY